MENEKGPVQKTGPLIIYQYKFLGVKEYFLISYYW